MKSSKRARIIIILWSLCCLLSVGLGLVVGITLAGMRNYEILEGLDVTQSALPTQIFDINGRLITEFFSDEKREIVPVDEIPPYLVNAIITREDQSFYDHLGFSLLHMIRGGLGYFVGNYQGGGSTITVQVAGNKYADRREITVQRKLIEVWYSLMLEKKYSKNSPPAS